MEWLWEIESARLPQMRSWGAVGLVLTLGCGGVSRHDGLSSAGGGNDASGGVAGTFDAGKGDAASAPSAGESGAAGSAGALCAALPFPCDPGATYVDVSDTTTVRLGYTVDASSDQGDETCQILASGVSRCGTLNLSLSACSAPHGDGVCLDTLSTDPHYTDASGKRWSLPTLNGSSSQVPAGQAEGMVDLKLLLTLGSGSTYRELAVTAHVCADISATLVPCK